MKKLILVIGILLLTSGCFDYEEINNMAIVSGISIDYNNMYEVNFEILKTSEEESDLTYYIKGYGNTLSEAFSNASLSISKTPYLAHLKIILISEEVAINHLEDIIDFLLRDNHIRNIFYLVISKNTNAKDILTLTNSKIISNEIEDLIENNTYVNNIAVKENFGKFLSKTINPYQDSYLTSVSLSENNIKIDNIGIFNNYNLITFLSEEESSILNLLNNNSNEFHINVKCPNSNENIIMSTTKESTTNIEIEDNTIYIKPTLELRIIENHCNLDFKDKSTYLELNNITSNTLNEMINNLVTISYSYDSDILGIEDIYYKKYKTSIDFKNLSIKIESNTIINQNGLIFEVME